MTDLALIDHTFNQYVTEKNLMLGGVQLRLTFPNGRGASIINHSGSYGTELAVLDANQDLDYSTPITDDVLGYLDPESLTEALSAILALPPKTPSIAR